MSTTYTDTSPVVVSPEPKRSSCSCAAIGCGCLVVLLIVLGILVAVMWRPMKEAFTKAMNEFNQQFAAEVERQATRQIEDDPRVTERLGEPITITRDESVPFTFQDARMRFTVEGSKESATVDAVFAAPDQEFDKLEITFADGTKVDLLEEPPDEMGLPIDDAGDDSAAPPATTIEFQRPYAEAVQRASTDARVTERLGEPVRAEFIHADIQASRSEWEFALSGPNGRATAKAGGESDGTIWSLNRLEVTFDDDESVDLMEMESP